MNKNDKILNMKELAIRLHKGDDLRRSIEELCAKYNSVVVLGGVGCISHLRLRMAKAIEHIDIEEDYEIVSLTGTVSNGKAHIHMAVSDEKGNCLGGHLECGCIINTTCELVLGILEEYESSRSFDSNTGYDEIEFRKK